MEKVSRLLIAAVGRMAPLLNTEVFGDYQGGKQMGFFRDGSRQAVFKAHQSGFVFRQRKLDAP